MAKKEDNLIQNQGLSRKEVEEVNRKGGIRSGEVRRQRKTLREELLALLSKGDTQERISLAVIEKCLAGDTKAFEVIRDTIGEKPKEEISAEVENVIKVELKDD